MNLAPAEPSPFHHGREMILDDHARLLQELLDEARNQGPSFQGVWTSDTSKTTLDKVYPGTGTEAIRKRDSLTTATNESITAFKDKGVIQNTSQVGVKATLEQVWRKFEYAPVSDPSGMTTVSGVITSGLRHAAEDTNSPYVIRVDEDGARTVVRAAERPAGQLGAWDAATYQETEHRRLGEPALVLRGVSDLKAPVILSNGKTMSANIRVAAETDYVANERNLLLELTLSEGQSDARNQIRIGFGPATGGPEEPPQQEGVNELYRRYLDLLQNRIQAGTPVPFPTSVFQQAAAQMVTPLVPGLPALVDQPTLQRTVAEALQQTLAGLTKQAKPGGGN